MNSATRSSGRRPPRARSVAPPRREERGARATGRGRSRCPASAPPPAVRSPARAPEPAHLRLDEQRVEQRFRLDSRRSTPDEDVDVAAARADAQAVADVGPPGSFDAVVELVERALRPSAGALATGRQNGGGRAGDFAAVPRGSTRGAGAAPPPGTGPARRRRPIGFRPGAPSLSSAGRGRRRPPSNADAPRRSRPRAAAPERRRPRTDTEEGRSSGAAWPCRGVLRKISLNHSRILSITR
jgi:hypothetical protein